MNQLSHATKISYATVHDWSTGKATPTHNSIEVVLAKARELRYAIDVSTFLPSDSEPLDESDPYPARAQALRAFRGATDENTVAVLKRLRATKLKNPEQWGVDDWLRYYFRQKDATAISNVVTSGDESDVLPDAAALEAAAKRKRIR